MDAEIKVPFVENTELKVLPLKLGIGQYIAVHAILTTRDSGPFTCIFSKISLESSFLLAIANIGSCVGPQNKTGHPTG